MITKTLVNKFIVSLVAKALGEDFYKALGNGVLVYESLEGRHPTEEVFKRDFLLLMESFYQNINLFATAVQEYLSDREEDEDTLKQVAKALGVEVPGMQSPENKEQSPENKEETLKSVAQRLTENPKPAPRKKKKRSAGGVQKSAVQGRDPKTGRFLKKEA
jgi:hypothetical protein